MPREPGKCPEPTECALARNPVALATVHDLDTHLVHAHRWARVLEASATPRAWKPADQEEVRARRDVIDVALAAVEAWGTTDLREQARKDARKAAQICDIAAEFCFAPCPVVDLAAYRAQRAARAS